MALRVDVDDGHDHDGEDGADDDGEEDVGDDDDEDDADYVFICDVKRHNIVHGSVGI